jgi:hypothetical protein
VTAVFPSQAAHGGYAPPQQPGHQQPGHQQPEYQQPGYQQPGYQQPGYQQAGYQQAGYGQPGYPPGGYGVGYPRAPEATPKKKSKVLPVVLASIAVLLVLCVGGTAAAVVMIRGQGDETVEDADVAPTVPATPPSTRATRPAPPSEAAPGKQVRLVAPAKLNGRPKLTDPQFAGAAKTLQESLSRAPGATDSIGALYGDPADRDIVVVAAVAAPVTDPDQELSSTLLGAGTTGTKLTGIIKIDPGPLGGTAQCGNSTASGVRMAMCAWADDGSVGWFIWYFKSANQVRKEFPKLRGQVEKVG